MPTLTDRDARDFVIRSLTSFADDFDVDAIVAELHEIHDSYDFDTINGLRYWEVVAKHDKS